MSAASRSRWIWCPTTPARSIPGFRRHWPSQPDSAARNRYIFRDGRGPGGAEPPNNWQSVFGGPSWTRVDEPDGNPGQWYPASFRRRAAGPQLGTTRRSSTISRKRCGSGWSAASTASPHRRRTRNGQTAGSSGLRCRDAAADAQRRRPTVSTIPMCIAIHRNIRRVMGRLFRGGDPSARSGFSTMPAGPSTCAPTSCTWVSIPHGAKPNSTSPEIRHSIENTLAAAAIENATPTWTLENHDVVRAPSRYGGGAVGLDRARAMALVTLALPGAVFLYNGQELGLANVELPDEALRDPTWERSGHTVRGRDGCRIPIPWRGDTPPFGFSASADTWLPMPAGVGRTDRGKAAGGRRLDIVVLPSCARTYAVADRNSRGEVSIGWI